MRAHCDNMNQIVTAIMYTGCILHVLTCAIICKHSYMRLPCCGMCRCSGAVRETATDEQLMRMDEKKLKDVKEESELHLGSASFS